MFAATILAVVGVYARFADRLLYDGASRWLADKGITGQLLTMFFASFLLWVCVHGSCRFCWMAIVSKSDVHCVPTRNVFSVRCVGLYLSLFHLKRKCGRRGDDGTRMSAIRTRALLCAMLLI